MNYKPNLYRLQIQPNHYKYQRGMPSYLLGEKHPCYITSYRSLEIPSCSASFPWALAQASLRSCSLLPEPWEGSHHIIALTWKDKPRSGFLYWHFGPDHSFLWKDFHSGPCSVASLTLIALLQSWHPQISVDIFK